VAAFSGNTQEWGISETDKHLSPVPVSIIVLHVYLIWHYNMILIN